MFPKGDSFADIVVGAYRFTGGQNEVGASVAYYGKADGSTGNAALPLVGKSAFHPIPMGNRWEISVPPLKSPLKSVRLLDLRGITLHSMDLRPGNSKVQVPRPIYPGDFILKFGSRNAGESSGLIVNP